MNEIKEYKCFSFPLRNYIFSKGIREVDKGVSSKTGKVFYLFEVTEELSAVLTEWTENRKNVVE